MYAVIEDCGAQYKVAEGETIDIDLRQVQPGDTIEFDNVLLLSTDDGASLGAPTIAEAKVIGEVVAEVKGPKVVVMRFQRRKRHHRKTGHREHYTRVRIKEIIAPGATAAPAAEDVPAEATQEGADDGS